MTARTNRKASRKRGTVHLVINQCYGGFGLSTEAMKRLIEKNAKGIKVYTEEEYTGGRGVDQERRKPAGGGYQVDWIADVLYKDGKVYTYDDSVRDCPILIETVREMGEESWGSCARLGIIEIPDDVKYHIDEYDGIEHVAEDHRTWR